MSCTKNVKFSQLFSKLSFSFVPIELLTFFQKWKIPFLLLKRAFGIWALKNYTHYVKIIDFYLFVHIKMSVKKYFCVYKCILQWPPSANDNVHVFIYKKSEKNCEMIINIYKKPDTFQKERQFALRFYPQNTRHFTLRNFYDFDELAYIYIADL